MDEALRDMLSASGPVIGVLLLDIDDFKDINDRYGHRVGDEVLIELVGRLRDAVRPEDVVARWGGEEFLLLCRTEEHERVRVLAERIRTTVGATAFQTTVGELPITVSVGAVTSLRIRAGRGSRSSTRPTPPCSRPSAPARTAPSWRAAAAPRKRCVARLRTRPP